MRCVTRLAVAGLLALVASSNSARAEQLAVQEAAEPFLYGVATHFAQGRAEVGDLSSIRNLGANSFRDEVYWNQVEKQKGEFRVPFFVRNLLPAIGANGLAPLIVLGYGNKLYEAGAKPNDDSTRSAYADYCEFVVEATYPTARHFEIWNEWPHRIGGDGPGTLDGYLLLAKECVRKIRAARRDVTLIVGASTAEAINSGWLEEFVERGGLRGADGLALHTYFHSRRNASPEKWAGWLKKVAANVNAANSNASVPLYITEMGWPMDSNPKAVDELSAAAYLARTSLLARTVPSVKGLWWYEYRNRGTDHRNRKDNWGLVNFNRTLKAPYFAFQTVAPLVRGARSVREMAAPQRNVKVLHLSLEATGVLAVWSTSGQVEEAWFEFGKYKGKLDVGIAPTLIFEKGTVVRCCSELSAASMLNLAPTS